MQEFLWRLFIIFNPRFYAMIAWFIRNHLLNTHPIKYDLNMMPLTYDSLMHLVFLLYMNKKIISIKLKLNIETALNIPLKNNYLEHLELTFLKKFPAIQFFKNVRFKNLSTLSLTHITMMENDFFYLNQFPRLESLSLNQVRVGSLHIHPSAYFFIKKLKKFEFKEIESFMNKKVILSLIKNSAMTEYALTLRKSEFRAVLKCLKKSKILTSIELQFDKTLSSKQSYQLLRVLLNQKDLTSLKLTHLTLDSRHICIIQEMVSSFENLIHLSFLSCVIDNESMLLFLSILTKSSLLKTIHFESKSLDFFDLNEAKLHDLYDKIFNEQPQMKVFKILLKGSSYFDDFFMSTKMKKILANHYHILYLSEYYDDLPELKRILIRNKLFNCHFEKIQLAFENQDYRNLIDLLTSLEKVMMMTGSDDLMEVIFLEYCFIHLPNHPVALSLMFENSFFISPQLRLSLALELFYYVTRNDIATSLRIFIIYLLASSYKDSIESKTIVDRCFYWLKENKDDLCVLQYHQEDIYENEYIIEELGNINVHRKHLKLFFSSITPQIKPDVVIQYFIDGIQPIDSIYGILLFIFLHYLNVKLLSLEFTPNQTQEGYNLN